MNSKQKNKIFPVILIGFLSNSINGPIPILTKVYINKLADKYKMIPFYMERKKGKEELAAFNLFNIFYFIKHYLSWCISIIRYRPDIVHYPITSYWNMEKSLLFLTTAKLLGVKKTIGHLHGGAFIDFWNSTNKLRKYLAHEQLKHLDILIVLSKTWKENIVKHIKIEENKIKILHNLIDSEFEYIFHNCSIREKYTNNEVCILGFNLMDSRKGVFDLLDAISNITKEEKFRLDIIGDEREPNIIKKIDKRKIKLNLHNVYLHKGIWGSEKIDLFHKSDILVLPSYIENFPVVVLEAACAGIPVIASKLGALPDIFTNNEDILFIEPGNVQQLKQSLELLISNSNERIRLGRNIRKNFEENLSGNTIIEELDAIYQNILKTY